MDEAIRVLLVDDEASFREPLMERLRPRGFLVTEASSGPEALQRARACHGEFDVAIIDQSMGPPNGTETMLMLQRLYPAIECIILAGWGNMKPGERAMELGAFRYRGKPLNDLDELAIDIRAAARLSHERRRRASLEDLMAAGHHIGEAQDEEELYQRVCEKVQTLLPGMDDFLVSEWDSLNCILRFPFFQIRGERQEYPHRQGQGQRGITEYVIDSGEPLLLPDGDDAFRKEHDLSAPPLGEACTSSVIAILRYQGSTIGTISASTFDPNVHYSDAHLEALQSLADQLAGVLRNLQQLREARELKDAVAALASMRGKEAVLQAIVQEADRLIGSDITGLILQKEDGTLRTAKVIPEGFVIDPRHKGGITRSVIESRETKVIPDTLADPLVKEELRAAGMRSVLAMPLVYGDRVLGVLYTHTRVLRYHSQHDLGLWDAFATQAATVLYGALEQEEEQARLTRQLDAVIAIFQAYRQRLNEKTILKRIAAGAVQALDIDVCTVIQYDSQGGFSNTSRGTAELKVPADSFSVPERFRAFLEKHEPTIVLDTREHQLLRDSAFMQRESIISAAIFPLYVDEEPLGLLFANYRYPRQFTSGEVKQVGLFADLAALALYLGQLRGRLDRSQERLGRHTFLIWVSMLQDTYLHSLVQAASAIRNHVYSLQVTVQLIEGN